MRTLAISAEKVIAESAEKETENCVGFVSCRKKRVFLRQKQA